MKSIGICGHFGGRNTFLDGQTIKTKNLTAELQRRFGCNEVEIVDTYGGRKHYPVLMFQLVKLMLQCRNIVILPAQNGLRLFVPLCSLLNKILNRKLHYVVIGGWLPQYLVHEQSLMKQLKNFTGIYVETSTMKSALEQMGFNNVSIMPNFKDIRILEEDELVYSNQKPYKLCTFSRVMQEKGIEDAVKTIERYNRVAGETVFTLDIYGQVDRTQTEWFDGLAASFPDYVEYKGCVPAKQSVGVLKDYYALLFPTRFYTEGIPGTIIDAYAAGIPVISAKWESFSDVVDDRRTGFGFEFGNQEAFFELLGYFAESVEQVNRLKTECIAKAKDYSPEVAILPLIREGELK